MKTIRLELSPWSINQADDVIRLLDELLAALLEAYSDHRLAARLANDLDIDPPVNITEDADPIPF